MKLESIKNREVAERMWPEIFGLTSNKPVELTNGELLCNRYGKYQPNLCFVLNEEGAQIGWDDDNVPKLNLEFDGDIDFIPGDFWVSKKGTHCFRPKKDGKHILLRVNWGGCFVSTRGYEYEEVKTLAIFSRRAGSNGGGTGFNFYIFPCDFHRDIDIEDI